MPSRGSGDLDGHSTEGMPLSGFPITLSVQDSPSDFYVPIATVRLLLASEEPFGFRPKFPWLNIFSQFGSRVQ